MKRKNKLSRIGTKFDREITEIIRKRRVDVDKEFPKEISRERLTDAITEIPTWEEIKRELLRAPRRERFKR